MTNLRQNVAWTSLAIICLTGTITACSTSNIRDSDSTTVPRWEWAAFDGDTLLGDDNRDFHTHHRVLALNGHDLIDGPSARVKDYRINCLLRDCKLHPGQHSIDVGYSWTESDAAKKQRRKDTLKGIGYALSVPVQILFGKTPGAPPASRSSYQCRFTLTFEVAAKHRYVLNVNHNNQDEKPEEFQIVDIASGAVVASANPC